MDNLQIGTRVEIAAKCISGMVSFIGTTDFAPGKWVGIVLDTPGGKNNGTVQGKQYFTCESNYGMFVRVAQLTILQDNIANKEDNEVFDKKKTIVSGLKKPSSSRLNSETYAKKSTLSETGTTCVGTGAPSTSISAASSSSALSACSTSNLSSASSSSSLATSSHGDEPQAPTSAAAPASRTGSIAAPRKSLLPSSSTSAAKRSTAGKVKPPSAEVAPAPTSLSSSSSASNLADQETVRKPAQPSKSVPAATTTTTAGGAGGKKTSPRSAMKKPASSAKQTSPKQPSPTATKPAQGAATAHTSTSVNGLPRSIAGGLHSTQPDPAAGGEISSNENVNNIARLMAQEKQLRGELDSLLAVRLQYKLKLKESVTINIQLEQLMDYKEKSHNLLQDVKHKMQKAEQEKDELHERFQAYKLEFNEQTEYVEMLSIDKEMAEEKMDTYQSELEDLQEKIDSKQIDYECLKKEIENIGTEEEFKNNDFKIRQCEQQIQRIQEELINERNTTNANREINQTLEKQNEIYVQEIDDLTEETKAKESEINDKEKRCLDLVLKIDTMQESLNFIEKITDKLLDVEDNVSRLEEEKADLEDIGEVNEGLKESVRDRELSLQEQLQAACNAEVERRNLYDLDVKIMEDHQRTVQQFQGRLAAEKMAAKEEARRTSEAEERPLEGEPEDSCSTTAAASPSTPPENGDASVPASSLCDVPTSAPHGQPCNEDADSSSEGEAREQQVQMQRSALQGLSGDLARLSHKDSSQTVNRSKTFCPQTFDDRTGVLDCVELSTILPRILYKIYLITKHTRESIQIPESFNRDQVFFASQVKLFVFTRYFLFQLNCLNLSFSRLKDLSSKCSLDVLTKLIKSAEAIRSRESCLDLLLDIVVDNKLNDLVSLEPLNSLHDYILRVLADVSSTTLTTCNDPLTHLADRVDSSLCGFESLQQNIHCLKLVLCVGLETSDASLLLKDIDSSIIKCKTPLKQISETIKKTKNEDFTFRDTRTISDLEVYQMTLRSLTMTLNATTTACIHKVNIEIDCKGLTSSQLAKQLKDDYEDQFKPSEGQDIRSIAKQLHNTWSCILDHLNNGDYRLQSNDNQLANKTTAHQPDSLVMFSQSLKCRDKQLLEKKEELGIKKQENQALRVQMKNRNDQVTEVELRMQMNNRRTQAACTQVELIQSQQQKISESKNSDLKKTVETTKINEKLGAERDKLEDNVRNLYEDYEGLTCETTGQGNTIGKESLKDKQVRNLRKCLKHCKEVNNNLSGNEISRQIRNLGGSVIKPRANKEVRRIEEHCREAVYAYYNCLADYRVVDIAATPRLHQATPLDMPTPATKRPPPSLLPPQQQYLGMVYNELELKFRARLLLDRLSQKLKDPLSYGYAK